jgi:hypothetical protein
MIYRALVVASLILISGCTSKYRVDAPVSTTGKLSPAASFYVAQPKDGTYGATTYPGSGAMTARAASAALATKVSRIELATTSESAEQAIATARSKGLQYVFEPTILNWEDRATQWSGIPDKLTLKFMVYSTEDGKPVASTVVSASSKWATFGGDHPQDLLPFPTQQFVNAIF